MINQVMICFNQVSWTNILVHVGSIQMEVLWICLQFGFRMCNMHVVAFPGMLEHGFK